MQRNPINYIILRKYTQSNLDFYSSNLTFAPGFEWTPYNSTILNSLYEKMVANGVDQSIIDEFLRTSPIAWGYLTFTGRYNFRNSKTKIDLERTVNSLAEKLLQTLLQKRQKN